MMTKRNFYVVIEMENFTKDRRLGFMITKEKKLITEVDGEKNELKILSGNSRGKHKKNY